MPHFLETIVLNRDIIHDFVRVSGGIKLRIHRYRPKQKIPERKYPIVLVHGLLNSSDLFDIPGAEDLSLARILGQAGYDVYTYDQRGAGDSPIEDWAVGLKEDAYEDLPAVIEYSLKNSQAEKVILGGYSLGGLIIYLCVSSLVKQDVRKGGPQKDQIHRVFAIASPGALHSRTGRWKKLFIRGQQMLDSAGVSIEREEFLKGQFLIRFPLLSRLVGIRTIKSLFRFAGTGKFAACLVKSVPFPTFLYKPLDFDCKTFARVARSKLLDRSPTQVFTEFFSFAQAGGKISIQSDEGLVTLPEDFEKWSGIPLLLFSSGQDELVLTGEVREVEKRVESSRLVIIENEIGISCGHAGYLFQKKIAPFVHKTMLEFLIGK